MAPATREVYEPLLIASYRDTARKLPLDTCTCPRTEAIMGLAFGRCPGPNTFPPSRTPTMKSWGQSRRQFLQAAGLAIAAPTSLRLGVGRRGPAPGQRRIVMGTIGCGGQGTGDMHGFMGFPEVQMVAVCDLVPEHREKPAIVNGHYQQPGLHDLQRLPRAAGPAGHRRRADRHARPLARHHHHRGLQARQGRVLRKARMPDDPRGPGHGRGGPALRPGVLRRQPARAGRLRRLVPRLIWGGALGQIREVFVSCGGPSGDCSCPPQPVPPGWIGTCGWGRPRGGRSMTA